MATKTALKEGGDNLRLKSLKNNSTAEESNK